MTKIWDYIVNDFLSFIGTLSIFGSVAIGMTYILKKYVDNQLQKNLQGHKQEMDKQIESLKHIQLKAYKEFDLYTTKRHEVYPELHKLVQQAYGEIIRLRGIKLSPDFRNYSPSELKEFLEKNKVGEQDTNQLLDLFSKDDKRPFDRKISETVRDIEYYKTHNTWNEANNYLVINELYLTELSAKASIELLQHLRNFWINVDPELPYDKENSAEIDDLKKNILPESLKKFKNALKKDLSESFSDQP